MHLVEVPLFLLGCEIYVLQWEWKLPYSALQKQFLSINTSFALMGPLGFVFVWAVALWYGGAALVVIYKVKQRRDCPVARWVTARDSIHS
jgi:hypothetical protein